MPFARLFVLPLALALCSPGSRAIVNEVVYDAIGDDTGWEFVELLNPGGAAVPLAGVRLEAGDGSSPGRWTLRWTGAGGDTVRAFSRFVIGGARVVPAPDAVVTLDLQNGPDALRLVWPDGATEVVGWGAHDFPEYACGTPAPDVAGGQSLARIPDAADLGSNALDFRAADPSPGRANQPGRDLALLRGSSSLVPERPEVGVTATLSARVTHRGRERFTAGEATLRLSCAAWVEPRAIALPALAPGETLRAEAPVELPAGAWAIEVRAAVAGDETPGNDADTLHVAAGPPPITLTEIQFHPAALEGEWVELRGASGEGVELAGVTLSDRSGTRARVGHSFRLARDSLVLLAQNRVGFLANHPGIDSSRVLDAAPWPSLNNTDDGEGIADVLELRESSGVLAERVPYSARDVPAGFPIENDQGVWRPTPSSRGTPLAPPALPAPIPGRFTLAPIRVRTGGETRVAWDLPWPRAKVSVTLWDLAGRRVANIAPEALAPGRGERLVSLAGRPAGFYVAVLTARADDGTTASFRHAVRIDGREL